MVIVISNYRSIKKVIEDIENYMEDPLKDYWTINHYEKHFYLGCKPFYGLVTRSTKHHYEGIFKPKKIIDSYTLNIAVVYGNTEPYNGHITEISFSSEEDRDSAYRQILEWFNKVKIKEGIEV